MTSRPPRRRSRRALSTLAALAIAFALVVAAAALGGRPTPLRAETPAAEQQAKAEPTPKPLASKAKKKPPTSRPVAAGDRRKAKATTLPHVTTTRPSREEVDLVLRLIGDGHPTLLARLGAANIDPAALKQFRVNLARQAAHLGVAEKLRRAETEFRDRLASFAEAGGRDMYWVEEPLVFPPPTPRRRTQKFPPPAATNVTLIFPPAPGADARRLTDHLHALWYEDALLPFEPVEMGGALVAATRMDVARKRVAVDVGGAEDARPELVDIFLDAVTDTADDSPFCAVASGAALESAFRTLDYYSSMAAAPKDLPLGGIRWAVLSLTQPPDIRLNLTLRATNVASAKALIEVLTAPSMESDGYAWLAFKNVLASDKPTRRADTVSISCRLTDLLTEVYKRLGEQYLRENPIQFDWPW